MQAHSPTPTIRIELPAALQSLAGSSDSVAVDGATVGEALTDLGRAYPLVLTRILTRGGQLRPHVNLFVNGRDIRAERGLATPLQAGDTLLVVASVAGG